MHEFNSFYDLLGTDADIDVFSASMGFGGDPNPAFMFGRNAQFNFMRYASEQNDSLLKDIRSDASFDADYRKEAFKKWQDFIMDEVPMVPTLYRYQLTTFNNRIKHYDATPQGWTSTGTSRVNSRWTNKRISERKGWDLPSLSSLTG